MTERTPDANAQVPGDPIKWPHLIQLGRTLGLFASVIKSGEPWTTTCQAEYDLANAAMKEAYADLNSRVVAPPAQTQKLGKFGHHPDPAIDFEVEVETLQSLLYDATHGVTSRDDIPAVRDRIAKAMEFRVGGDTGAIAAKQTLRGLEAEAAKHASPPAETRPEDRK